jgi:hypothetical protein
MRVPIFGKGSHKKKPQEEEGLLRWKWRYTHFHGSLPRSGM